MSTNSELTPPGDKQGKLADTVIRLGVLALLVIWCFQILQPFIIPIVWAIVIAVAIHPLYEKLVNVLRGRDKLAAILVTIIFLVLLMVPTIMLTKLLAENVATLTQEVRSEQLSIPLPPDNVKEWPLIGEPVAKIWNLAATNFGEVLKLLHAQLKAFGAWLVKLAASAGMAMLMSVLSVVIAGVLLAHSASSYRLVHSISRRLAGARGDELTNLVEATIRSVARGVLGVAVIQALMAGLGECGITGIRGELKRPTGLSGRDSGTGASPTRARDADSAALD